MLRDRKNRSSAFKMHLKTGVFESKSAPNRFLMVGGWIKDS